MENLILIKLGVLKILSLWLPSMVFILIICGTITKLKNDKSWLKKLIYKFIY